MNAQSDRLQSTADIATTPSTSSTPPAISDPIAELQRLVDVIAKLRDPNGGCPWDLKQTPDSLTPYVLEEAYEVVDAIKRQNSADIAEELGDLLLQVVLQAQVFQDQGEFDLGDVAKGITDKMVRRHPHVFEPDNPDKQLSWDEIKQLEKADQEETDKLSPTLRRYAKAMPPLAGAMKISRKAAKVGFEWDSIEAVWEKVNEEIQELRHAIDHESKAAQESELGDVLFSLLQVARWQGLDPVAALLGTNRRFVQRFEKVESQIDKPMSDYSEAELNAFWQKAKQHIAQQEKVQRNARAENVQAENESKKSATE